MSGDGEAASLAVALEAPIVETDSAPVDDPMQDPFGDSSPSNVPTLPQPPTPPSPSQTLSQGNRPGPLEVLPAPPPLMSQTPPPQRGPVTTEILSQNTSQGELSKPSEDSQAKKTPQELLEGIPPAPVDTRPMEEQLAQTPPMTPDECPPFGRMRKISEITNDISASPGKFPTECPLQEGEFMPRQWEPVVFTWKASGLCHKPLYFEHVAMERYGHNLGPILQYAEAGTHFFLTIPILPYKMGLNPPDECIYPLGYYRPGSCAPWILDPIPLSVRAGLAEAGVWTGMVFLIP